MLVLAKMKHIHCDLHNVFLVFFYAFKGHPKLLHTHSRIKQVLIVHIIVYPQSNETSTNCLAKALWIVDFFLIVGLKLLT